MKIIVQKYGGKLVADVSKIRQVAHKIADTYQQGNAVVVVVSAMGDMTNQLEKQVLLCSQHPNRREKDAVLAVGEQITIGMLSITLQEMDYRAISFTGWQAGIQTDSHYHDANILRIQTNKIQEKLQDGYIVIVAGFQGVDAKENITTLGRRGFGYNSGMFSSCPAGRSMRNL